MEARSEGIVLTHLDHAGAALDLTGWDVPIYTHPLELPYLTGRSDYPPFPSTGRYVGRSAQADEEGAREMPPPVPDLLPKRFAAGATMAVAAGAVGISLAWRRGRCR